MIAAIASAAPAVTPCACAECRALDREYPNEGRQLALVGDRFTGGGHEPAADHPDASPPASGDVRAPKGRSCRDARSRPPTAESHPPMNAQTKIAKLSPHAEGPAVQISTMTMVEFRHLRRAPENVRHTDIDKDIGPLADNIAANGLLQSLIGYREGKKQQVWIVGGGRRLQALERLLHRFQIDPNFLVPVLLRDRDEAVELSLSENLERHDMNPADEFEAFATLMKRGDRSPADLAKRFGYSERYVKQRLRLAELAPEILDGLRHGQMTLTGALAYVKAPDQAVQRQVFEAQKRKAYDKHDPASVGRAVSDQSRTTAWSLYRYVGAAAYERAGGQYDEGLFEDLADDAPRALANQSLVPKLAQDMIDFQMIGRLKDMAADLDCETVSGHLVYPDLDFPPSGWPMTAPTPPEGYAWVGREWSPDAVERMWKTVRNNGIDVRLLVGIEDGRLIAFKRGFFVAADQKNAVSPDTPAPQRATISPEDAAATERAHGIELWAKRLAVGQFEGSFLDGRAFWTPGWAGSNPDRATLNGKQGWWMPLRVFVSEDEVAAQKDAAPARYERAKREEAEALESKRIAEEEAREQLARRNAELEAMEPPAIVVIDGEPWALQHDGGYAVIGDEESSFVDTWKRLCDVYEVATEGTIFATREEFEAAHAAARSTV